MSSPQRAGSISTVRTYFFYPEAKKRSLEEIDLIFTKGYLKKISYAKASFDMPLLNDREVEAMAREYGFIDSDEEKIGEKMGKDRKDDREGGHEEKPRELRRGSERSDSDRTL
jgi:hypothetical protein